MVREQIALEQYASAIRREAEVRRNDKQVESAARRASRAAEAEKLRKQRWEERAAARRAAAEQRRRQRLDERKLQRIPKEAP
jgi:hypothetical protein